MEQPQEEVIAQAVYSREEAARLLGIGHNALDGLIKARDLKVSKLANRVLIRGADIFDMLEKTRIPPGHA